MTISCKNEIIDILNMPIDEFKSTVMKEAKEIHKVQNGNKLTAVSMMGYDNICKNQCLYCGMRGSNTKIKRYKLTPSEVKTASQVAKSQGFNRVFYISGEDPSYGFSNLVQIVKDAKEENLHVSLACGEFTEDQFKELRDAGTDQFVIKFEMSQPEVFNRLNPSTTFENRMKCIETVKKLGLELASGNIVDYPGHTAEQIAEDIMLMKDLEISWAPIIPYMPAIGTPLALEGGRGNIWTNLKEISILRIMMPNIFITAQQPGEDMTKGLAGDEGNLLALNAGADMLFADMLPNDLVASFSVIDNRVKLGLDHIYHMAEISNMNLTF